MNGKDLLAMLVMIVPGLLLIAMIAFSLVPASMTQPLPGSGLVRDDSRKELDSKPRTEKAHAMREVSVRSAAGPATQKRMRNPWEKLSYAKNMKASAQ
jgi:hypothetical protein